MPSPFLSLNQIDWLKIVKGALIVAAGAILAHLDNALLPQLDDGLATAIYSIAVNGLRKLLSGPRGA